MAFAKSKCDNCRGRAWLCFHYFEGINYFLISQSLMREMELRQIPISLSKQLLSCTKTKVPKSLYPISIHLLCTKVSDGPIAFGSTVSGIMPAKVSKEVDC